MSSSKRKVWVWGSAAVLLVLLIFWQVSKITFAEPISMEEATRKVQDLYKSEVLTAKETDQTYLLTIALDTGIYNIIIDKKTGDIQSVAKLEDAKNDGTIAMDQPQQHADTKQPETEEQEVQQDVESQPPNQQQESQTSPNTQGLQEYQNHTEPNVQPNMKITAEQAIAIALKHVSGEVDDVEVENWSGVDYYLVEIERDDDADATIQIHAITGEVKSITWED